MKKITSKKLLNYGAMSAALLGVVGANGQIMYTDIEDVTLVPGDMPLNIDLLGTGDTDFQAELVNAAGGGAALLFPGENGNININNGFVGTSVESYGYPLNLTEGTIIDENSATETGLRGDLNLYGCSFPNSQFCDGVIDGYIGLVFDLNGNTHYGWTRVDIADDASSFTIKDYAVNITANEAISAGQQTLSLEDNTIEGFTSYITDNILNLRASTVIENLTIHNIAGQSVLSQKISDVEGSIDISNLTTGIYIATVAVEGKQQAIKIVKR